MSIHGAQQQSSWLQRKRADASSSICRPTLASSASAKKGLPCGPGAALPDSLTTVGSTPIGLSLSLPNSVLSPTRIPLDTRQTTDPGRKPRLGFAGGGVFFFWQLGVVLYLREVYDLTQVEMAGASCGAICATLAACGVEPEDILEAAVDMAMREKVWERSVDVLGTIGPAVQEWLDALLPDDAHLLLRDRVEIVIGRFPNLMDQFAISDFTSKDDVIQANMASAHVPFVLDAKPLREFRGQKCVDGSFADFINYQNSYYLTRDASVVFDYTYDTSLQLQSRLDFLRIRSYDEILEMIDAGRAYAERLHREGALPLQV